MGVFGNILTGLFGKGAARQAEKSAVPPFDLNEWNRIGRAKAQQVCTALAAVIDRDEEVDDDFFADERTEEFADAVLDQVIALNQAGQWQQARERFDTAHQPFLSHMGELGLHAVVILGPQQYLVRRGDEVLHVNDSEVVIVEGASMFAISRN